jgi:hypothetical protein
MTPPAWIVDLLEYSAKQERLTSQPSPTLIKIKALRTQLLASKSTDLWSVYGRWYFSDSAERPISPWSTVSLQQYVDSLIALGDKDSLDYAYAISFDHPVWMERISALRAKLKLEISDKTHGSK